jgi:hypothetical protein
VLEGGGMHSHLTTHTAVTIRMTGAADTPALRRLAQLDSQSPLTGPSLIVEVDREPWAAVELDSGRVVADPFRPSSHVAQAAQAHSSGLRRAA